MIETNGRKMLLSRGWDMGSECIRSQCKYLLLCCLQRKIYRIVMAVQMESSEDLGYAETDGAE